MMQRPSYPRRAFVLLEVLVSIVIVGVAMVAMMRGFVVSLDTLKKVRMNEQAIYLAKSLMDDLMIEPPDARKYSGVFSEDIRFGDAFEGWQWEIDVTSDAPRYKERPSGRLPQELEEVYFAEVRVFFVDRNRDRQTYVTLLTILMDPDIFSMQAIQANQLF